MHYLAIMFPEVVWRGYQLRVSPMRLVSMMRFPEHKFRIPEHKFRAFKNLNSATLHKIVSLSPAMALHCIYHHSRCVNQVLMVDVMGGFKVVVLW